MHQLPPLSLRQRKSPPARKHPNKRRSRLPTLHPASPNATPAKARLRAKRNNGNRKARRNSARKTLPTVPSRKVNAPSQPSNLRNKDSRNGTFNNVARVRKPLNGPSRATRSTAIPAFRAKDCPIRKPNNASFSSAPTTDRRATDSRNNSNRRGSLRPAINGRIQSSNGLNSSKANRAQASNPPHSSGSSRRCRKAGRQPLTSALKQQSSARNSGSRFSAMVAQLPNNPSRCLGKALHRSNKAENSFPATNAHRNSVRSNSRAVSLVRNKTRFASNRNNARRPRRRWSLTAS